MVERKNRQGDGAHVQHVIHDRAGDVDHFVPDCAAFAQIEALAQNHHFAGDIYYRLTKIFGDRLLK